MRRHFQAIPTVECTDEDNGGNVILPENIVETTRSGHVTAGVWGWISGFGVGELAEIDGRFTGGQYVEIMEEVLLPSVRAYAIPEPETIYVM